MKRSVRIMLGLSLPLGVMFLWWLATNYGEIPSQILPTPQAVWAVYMDREIAGKLFGHLLISLRRVLIGFFAASIIGLLMGSLTGVSKTLQAILLPTLTAIRQIPIIAWIPLLIFWTGIGEPAKIAVIILAAFFTVFVNTHAGISGMPVNFLEIAQLYKLSRVQTFILVYLPYALPNILTGLQLGLGISWMAGVASELISATSGIGYYMNDARFFIRSDIMIACMLVIGFVGFFMNTVLIKLFEFITPWNVRERKGNGKGYSN